VSGTQKNRNALSASTTTTSPQKSGTKNQTIDFAEISSCLNGIGRIVAFSTTHQDRTKCWNPTIDPKANLVISLTEGRFVNGQLEGFGRSIDSAGDCKVGFWAAADDEETKAYGKFG